MFEGIEKDILQVSRRVFGSFEKDFEKHFEKVLHV